MASHVVLLAHLQFLCGNTQNNVPSQTLQVMGKSFTCPPENKKNASGRDTQMKPTNTVFTGLETTVFERMSRLAMEHTAINLGQGFPDVDGPQDVRQVAADSLMQDPNQYPPMLGVPALRQAVADNNKRFYDLDIDWQSEVLVTSGATEALADSIFALVEPGDESFSSSRSTIVISRWSNAPEQHRSLCR